jgi:hypothetical protein
MKHLFISLIGVIFCLAAEAQRFEVSTAGNPQWFFIQVKGADLTAGLVITENGGLVSGEAIKNNGLTEISKQLWRVERGAESNSYLLVNKFSGKKLDIAYDAEKGERIAVASEAPLTEWNFLESAGSYRIRARQQPDGGTSGAVYLLQTGSAKNYVLAFATSASSDDSKFQFISFSSFPVASTANETIWLRMQNAKTSLTGKYLTDTGDNTLNGPFLMLDQTGDDFSQQWKILSKNTDSETGRVEFINRETGRAIGTIPVYDIYYYLPPAVDFGNSEGWRIRSLDNSLYAIAFGSPDAEWLWNATENDEPQASVINPSDKEQGFAWSFSLAEEIISGIEQPETLPGVRVYILDKIVYVEGTDSYTVTNLFGSRMINHRPLPVGVYLVNVNGQITKVLVK